MDFAIAGAAAASAGFFTNPMEVMKTRMQLQGELTPKGKYSVHYKNVFHAGYVVAKHDGVLGLQKGLAPGLAIQLVLNGLKLGTYQFANSQGYTKDADGHVILYRSMLFGGLGGVVGQFFANPFYLIKTHLQSQTAKRTIAVGHQHNHEGAWHAFKTIYTKHGVKGLFRGAGASIPRSFVGATSQLTTFSFCKEALNASDANPDHPFANMLIASAISGMAISVTMTPFDFIYTRMCNQAVDKNGKGLLYKNYLHCVTKIARTEGFRPFVKGMGASYMKFGPHTMLCLVFCESFKDAYKNYWANAETKGSS